MIKKHVKLLISTDPNEWHGMNGERLWVKKVGRDLYEIHNIPLYAYGISFADIVETLPVENKILKFKRVIKAGGHSNYRVLLKNGYSKKDFEKLWPSLEALGCSYESSNDPEDVFGIDVPPEVDVLAVYKYLEEGVKDGVWYLDEGNFEHIAFEQ